MTFRAVVDVLRSDWLTTGPKVAESSRKPLRREWELSMR
jgi:dTDP-4-amino-4,6-dideoxygalactose transaminase